MAFAALLNLIASVIWGFSFIAQRWALESFGSAWICAGRFYVAIVVFTPFVLRGNAYATIKSRAEQRHAAIPALCLIIALLLQTEGLKYTTVAKSGFITCLYVVLLPLLESVLLKHTVSIRYYILATMGLLGTGLLSQFQSGDWNRGDVMTLGCAIASAFQVISMGKLAPQIKSPVGFTFLQMVWCAVIATPVALVKEGVLTFTATPLAFGALLFLGIAPTAIAYLFQAYAQRVLSPTIAGLIWLLEAPLSAIFAMVLFAETLTTQQYIGALFILIASGTAVLGRRKRAG